MTLTSNEKHLMRLILKDRNTEGWAKVSKLVLPLVTVLPKDLVEVQQHEDGTGLAKLTKDGETVLIWS